MNVTNSWYVTPYSQVQLYWRFRRKYCLLQNRKVSREGKHLLAYRAYFSKELMCPTEMSENILQTTRRRAPWGSILCFRTVHNGSCRGHSIWGDCKISTPPPHFKTIRTSEETDRMQNSWRLKQAALNHLVCLTEFQLRGQQRVTDTSKSVWEVWHSVTAQFLRHFSNRCVQIVLHSTRSECHAAEPSRVVPYELRLIRIARGKIKHYLQVIGRPLYWIKQRSNGYSPRLAFEIFPVL
jgi:hypothetical protein